MANQEESDLEDVIRSALDEAADKIIAAIEAQQQAFRASLHEALEELDVPGEIATRGRTRKSNNNHRRRRKRPPRSEWVRTTDVVETLRGVFADHPDGVRIAELRDLTAYSDMQLHRALNQLRDNGEVVKEGELRKTIYLPATRRRHKRR